MDTCSSELGYLAGLFDGEGHVSGGGYRIPRRAAISNTETRLLEEAKRILSTLGINCKIYQTTKNHDTWKDCYTLTIYGAENLYKFYCMVPFLSPEKRGKFLIMLKSYKRKGKEWTLAEAS